MRTGQKVQKWTCLWPIEKVSELVEVFKWVWESRKALPFFWDVARDRDANVRD